MDATTREAIVALYKEGNTVRRIRELLLVKGLDLSRYDDAVLIRIVLEKDA